MAIKSNDSATSVVGGGLTYYSGLASFKVVAVNPTLEELHAIGVNFKTEPNYEISLGGVEYNKITFWIQNDDLTTSFDILVNTPLADPPNEPKDSEIPLTSPVKDVVPVVRFTE